MLQTLNCHKNLSSGEVGAELLYKQNKNMKIRKGIGYKSFRNSRFVWEPVTGEGGQVVLQGVLFAKFINVSLLSIFP